MFNTHVKPRLTASILFNIASKENEPSIQIDTNKIWFISKQ